MYHRTCRERLRFLSITRADRAQALSTAAHPADREF